MQIEITRKFRKQVDDCKDQRIRSKILSIIENVISADKMNDFHNLKKLTGHKNSYRIRLGTYRVGIIIEGNTVIFAAFDHRSDIYKYFP
jgi:mRNA interferase RelE/StbE